MKVIKDRYKLILREPGKEEKELWVGSKRGCEKKKLDFKKLLITCSVLIMMLLSITAISNIWCSSKFYDEFKDEFVRK